MTNTDFHPGAIDAGGCITNGWNLVQQNYGMYLGMGLLAVVMTGCLPCVSLFLYGPVIGGVYYVLFRAMRNEHVEFGMMFKGFEKFVPLMVIGIIQSIPEIIGQALRLTVDLGRLGVTGNKGRSTDFFQSSGLDLGIASGLMIIIAIAAMVAILFAVVWRVLLFFAIPIAVERDIGPMEAIKLSARAATSNVGGLIVLFIFEFLITLLGVVALCIGVFFVIPIIYAANAFAYRQVFPWVEQNFRMPPNIYGGSAE